MSSLECKTGVLTDEEQQQYDHILLKKPEQYKQYNTFLKELGEEGKICIRERCQKMGFDIDFNTGRLAYQRDFHPLAISYDLWFIRHGKTEGNTEPRIYQGQVDYPNNQLNHVGCKQAEAAADKMDKEILHNSWFPDLIVYSPLTRAKATGEAFAIRHPEIPTSIEDGIIEMAFGNWDDVRVIDVPHDSMAHLFYLDQNALVKSSEPHVVRSNAMGYQKPGTIIPAECFVDVLERLTGALHNVEKKVANIKERRPKVIMYGHSMAGAAISMLLGHGKSIENGDGLGFDGKYIMANATPTFLPPKKPF